MKKIETEIADLVLVELQPHRDSRGYFVERFNQAKFKELGLPDQFVQDNFGFSLPNVVRGLHMQVEPNPQGKLVSCLRGKILDVAVDLRRGSPTYGQWKGVELHEEDFKHFWIPRGFAHGYSVLSQEPAEVHYKTDGPYDPASERSVRFDDPEIGIHWGVDSPIVSEKDKIASSLQAFESEFPRL